MTDYLKLHQDYLNKGTFSKLILDILFDAFFTVSPEGIITSWSKGAEKMYGYSEQEIVGKSVKTLTPEDKSREPEEILSRVMKGEKIEGFQTRRVAKNGNVFELVTSIIPINEDGKIIGATVFHKNVTQQKVAEDKFQQLFEQASDAIFIADLNGRYTEVNASACNMLGYLKEELVGKTIVDLIPPEDVPRLKESKNKLLKEGKAQIEEWTLKKKDGTFVPVEISTKILPDGRWQAFVRDISEEKEAEKKFSFIFESAPDAQLIINAEGNIVLVNEHCENLFGYKKNELIGQKIELLIPERFRNKHVLNRGKFMAEFKRIRMGNGLQLTARKKDGSEIPVDIVLSPMRIDNDVIVLASVRDVTELKKLADYSRNMIGVLQKLNV